MANRLTVSDLDYLSIKNNLRVFFEDNPLFTDYNFDGSALDVLNSQLAYNTHYIGYYANMLFNEAFLDTAVKRESIVSIAKHLNYTPKSIATATAYVTIDVVPSGTPLNVFIPKGTKMAGTNAEGRTYNFMTLEDQIALPTGTANTYRASNVQIVQGNKRVLAYVKNINDETQRFVLPYANIDTKYLKVVVQKEESDTENEIFQYSDTILDITGESPVYFLQEGAGGKFEIYFGDGVLGKALEHGNIVRVEYLLTEGTDANGINTFSVVDSIGGSTSIGYTTVQPSVGGADTEDSEFIRTQAPRFYESQKRAVTQRDYETLLLNDVTYIRDNFSSVKVWGGEDNDPPLYGNVLISLQPFTGVVVTSFLKDQILEEIIDSNNVIGVIPMIVDPIYLHLELDVSVTYARNKTTLTRDQIVENVRTLLVDYRENTLSVFDKNYYLSEMSCLIDDSNPSFISNLIQLRIKKYETLLFNTNTAYTIDFNNPLERGTMQSTEFFVNEFGQASTDVYFFADDRNGNVILRKRRSDNSVVDVDTTFATIDYENGVVSFPCFAPVNLINADDFYISFEPQINDLFTEQNLIITYDDEDITITATGIQG